MHLAHALLDVERTEVDSQLGAATQAEFCPRALKDVAEREEIDDDIVRRDVEHLGVGFDGEAILRMEEEHAFGLAGGAAGVEDVGHVLVLGLAVAHVHLRQIGRVGIAQAEKFVEIDGEVVGLVALHRTVEDDDVLQAVAEAHHAPHHIILLLLAHKDHADFGIVDHILHLCPAAGGVEGDEHTAHGESAKFDKKTLGLVLRKHRHVVLHPHAQGNQRAGSLLHAPGKAVPRDGHPPPLRVVAILQSGAVAVAFGRTLHEL